MTDLATLGLAIDSSGVKAATSALRDFRDEGAKTEKQITSTVAAMAKGKPGAKEFADGLNSANAQSENFSKGTNKVIDSLQAQFVRINTNEKQWRIIQNVQRAGVELTSQEGAHIAKMTAALYDMEQAQKKVSSSGSTFNKVLGGSQVVAALGLFGIGFKQVFDAAKQLYDYLEIAGPSTEKVLQEQDRLVRVVRSSYDAATKSAKNFFDQSKDVTQLQLLQQQVDLVAKLRTEVGKTISNATTFGNIGDFVSGTRQIKENLLPFEDAIFKLKEGFDQGAPNVRQFADEVARIGLANPELQKAAADLIKSAGNASEFAEKLKAIQAALDLINGKGITNEGRAALGISFDKSAENLASAWDKQLASLSRRNAAMEAEARTVGHSDAAHEKMRTTLLLEDFLYNKGVTNIEAYRAKIEAAGDEAAKTAEKLARARINDNINFGRQTSLLSPEDVQIAQQLRGLYPDVATALDSVEASAMRTNNVLRDFSSVASQQLTTGLADIFDGTKSVSQGFLDMSRAIVRALEEAMIKMLIVQPIMRSLQGIFGGGGILGLFGFSDGGYVDPGSSSNPLVGLTAADYGPGFASGGFTGAGSKYQPAGVVHAGEFVFDSVATSRAGVPYLNRLHQTLRGYDVGGFVTVPSAPSFGGNVTQGPWGKQDNAAPSFTYAPNIDARGADAAAVARLASVMAKDKRDFEKNVQSVMIKYRANNPGSNR